MKKTYMIPTLKVVKIQTTHLMNNSIPTGSAYKSGDAVLGRQAGFSESADDDWE